MRQFASIDEYSRAVRDPATVHAICEDYRAGATCDRAADEADRAAGRTIECPVQVLWGATGAVGTWYEPLDIWREWAHDVIGEPIASGHFLMEENGAATLEAIRRFHG